MNKDSKYRELLDTTRNQICQAEIGVTGVFQLMMETLDTAEKEAARKDAEIKALMLELSICKARLSQFNDDMESSSGDIYAIKEKIKALNPPHQGEWSLLSGLIAELETANSELNLIDVLSCNMDLAEKNLVNPTKKTLPFEGQY